MRGKVLTIFLNKNYGIEFEKVLIFVVNSMFFFKQERFLYEGGKRSRRNGQVNRENNTLHRELLNEWRIRIYESGSIKKRIK